MTKKEKVKFKLPHILWIVLGIIVFAIILTYVIPSGQFGRDENGRIIASEFNYLHHQTPISLGSSLMLMLRGMTSQVNIMLMVMATGANIAILLEAGTIDTILSWTVSKLKEKGKIISIITLFVIMTYIGGFAGSDALLALVPIGVVFSRRMKLDPLISLGLTTFPAMIGFSTGPTTAWMAQAMMGVQPYSGSLLRFVLMNLFMIIGLIYLLRYIKRVEKNVENSLMFDEGWYPEEVDDLSESEVNETESQSHIRSLLTMGVFLGQYGFIIYYSLTGGSDVFGFTIAVNIISSVIMGIVNGMSGDRLGSTFAKGVNSMGFVAFVIGLAGVFSLILTEAKVIDTIIYTLTRPLMDINQGISNIGIAIVVSVLEIFIPSASSKAALMAPIITPLTDALDVTGQTAVHAYQIGDRWPNLISPVLGWLVGSLITAKVPYNKWLRWVLPILTIFIVLSLIILYILTLMKWTGL